MNINLESEKICMLSRFARDVMPGEDMAIVSLKANLPDNILPVFYAIDDGVFPSDNLPYWVKWIDLDADDNGEETEIADEVKSTLEENPWMIPVYVESILCVAEVLRSPVRYENIWGLTEDTSSELCPLATCDLPPHSGEPLD